nr:TVP38/TMEM64 family membrane protein like [Ipomoea batatas]
MNYCFLCCSENLDFWQILKNFLIWVKEDLGPWGPLILAIAYIPLTVLAVPASVLTLGGGYLFGLPVGFFADSIGATMGAAAAFLLGRTVSIYFSTCRMCICTIRTGGTDTIYAEYAPLFV